MGEDDMVAIFDKPSYAEKLGTSLSQGLGAGLQRLSEQQLNEVAEHKRMQQTYQGLAQIYGPQTAQAIMGLPQHLQVEALRQNRQQQESQALSDYFNRGQQQGSTESNVLPAGQSAGLAQQEQSLLPNAAEILKTGGKTGEKLLPQLQKQAELGIRQKGLEQKESHFKENKAIQQNKDIREALKAPRAAAKSANERIEQLDRLIDLSNKDLRSGPGQQLLTKAGLGNLWLDPNSQEAQAISNQLVLNLATQMKGSLSDKDVNFLRQSVPSLFNTPEGIRRIGKMMKLAAQGEKFYAEELANTFKKEGLSVDAEDRALEAAKKKKDRLAQEILKEVSTSSQFSVGQEFDELPDASSLPEGARLESPHGLLKPVNGKWVKA